MTMDTPERTVAFIDQDLLRVVVVPVSTAMKMFAASKTHCEVMNILSLKDYKKKLKEKKQDE